VITPQYDGYPQRMAYDIHLADRIREILRDRCAAASERLMFGGVAFMVDGHMCCGVVKTDLVVRLGPADITSALSKPHTRPMDFTGKPMKSMVYVGPRGTHSDDSLREWIESACTFVRTLPPKECGARRAKRSKRT